MLHDILEDRLYREPKHKENEVLFSGGVVDALFAATCNALKLLNSSWSAAADKHLHAVSLLCQPLYRCSTVWIQVSAHKDAVATKLATLAVRTGDSNTVQATCCKLVAALSAPMEGRMALHMLLVQLSLNMCLTVLKVLSVLLSTVCRLAISSPSDWPQTRLSPTTAAAKHCPNTFTAV